jgi:hypothetical protein
VLEKEHTTKVSYYDICVLILLFIYIYILRSEVGELEREHAVCPHRSEVAKRSMLSKLCY